MSQPYPDFLSHYYSAARGPFLNLSDLPVEEADQVLAAIRRSKIGFASQRAEDYLRVRRELEDRVRRMLIEKGGKPVRQRPQYMILGACPWLVDWYPDGLELRIPLAVFAPEIVSFTYGDIFPAMRYPDGKPYRRQVYTLGELPEVVGNMDCRKRGILPANTDQIVTSKPRSGTMRR